MYQSIPAVNIPGLTPRGIFLRGQNFHPRAKKATKPRSPGKKILCEKPYPPPPPGKSRKQVLAETLLITQISGNTSIHRVLPRIFCLGGESILKKSFEPRGGEKNFFRPSRGGGGMLPRKILKIRVQDWLKSHFWTLVTFTDSLKSSSKKIFIWNSCNFFSVKLLGGGNFPPPPPSR